MGLDPQAGRAELHVIVGAQLQASALPGQLKVGEIIDLYHSFYQAPADPGEIIDVLGLAGRAGVDKRVRFVPSKPFDDRLLTGLPGVRKVGHEGQHVTVTGSGELANAVILALAGAGVTATGLHLDTASLEDAFVALTGRHFHDEIGRIHR